MLIAELIGARAELQMAWMTGAGGCTRRQEEATGDEGGRPSPGLFVQGTLVRDDQPL